MRIIERKTYMDRLISVIGTPEIKVITGIRRSGKSMLLANFGAYLTQTFGSRVNLIRVDYNSRASKRLANSDALYQYIESQYVENKQNFVFIDEVQLCPNFETAINYLHNESKFDIYITGSNAFLLSSDLATLFTGRTYELEMFPFSFAEYLEYYEETNLDQAFHDYTLLGGMAGSYNYQTTEERLNYVRNVYNTMIVRDIKARYDIRNEELLNNLGNFLMDNISNLTSTRKIANVLANNGNEASDKTIGSYIEYLTQAFAFYKVRRYDIKGKKYLATQDKYYLVDQSFRIAMLGQHNLDYGRIYENMVAIELLRRGYDIYVGTLYEKEIDFVAMKRDEVFYIQVADDISRSETLDREISSLLSIKNAYKKLLLANTKHDTYDIEGIEVHDLAHWLSAETKQS